MKSTILAVLIALLLAVAAVAGMQQRIDLSLGGFRPFPDTEMEIGPDGLFIMTFSPQGGGVEQCIDFGGLPGPPTGFGGTVFIPDRHPGGQSNLGRGGIGVLLYNSPGCTGPQGQFLPGTPAIGETTPRNVPLNIAFNGTFPGGARSAHFVTLMATDSPVPFALFLRNAWFDINNGAPAGAPDLDPDTTIHIGKPVITGTPPALDITVEPDQALNRQGDTLPRGAPALVVVDVKNNGTAAASNWTVIVRPPAGWRMLTMFENTSALTADPNGRVFTHTGATPIPPGETRRVVFAFMPDRGAEAVQVRVEATVANDAVPTNNSEATNFIEVEEPRGGSPLPPGVLQFLNGRGF